MKLHPAAAVMLIPGLVLAVVLLECHFLFRCPHCASPRAAVWACRSNLKQLEGAKAAWAMDHGITNGSAAPTAAILFGKTNYIRMAPECPKGGTYVIGNLMQKPTCSVQGHTL